MRGLSSLMLKFSALRILLFLLYFLISFVLDSLTQLCYFPHGLYHFTFLRSLEYSLYRKLRHSGTKIPFLWQKVSHILSHAFISLRNSATQHDVYLPETLQPFTGLSGVTPPPPFEVHPPNRPVKSFPSSFSFFSPRVSSHFPEPRFPYYCKEC